MKQRSMLDYINLIVQAQKSGRITKEEFTRIRNTNDPDLIAEAVERMEAAGGYDNLED